MTNTTSGTLILLLIAVCLACAAYRLAAICWPCGGHHPRTGPSSALAVLSLCAALFLAIPLTLVWGLVLVALLAVCHLVSIWKRVGSASGVVRPPRPA
jgi:hypothetical protein